MPLVPILVIRWLVLLDKVFKKKININKGMITKKLTITEEIVWPVRVLIKDDISIAMLVSKIKHAIVNNIAKSIFQLKIPAIKVFSLKIKAKVKITKIIKKLERIVITRLKIEDMNKNFTLLICVSPIWR